MIAVYRSHVLRSVGIENLSREEQLPIYPHLGNSWPLRVRSGSHVPQNRRSLMTCWQLYEIPSCNAQSNSSLSVVNRRY
jgi:hypothetical protein